MFVTYIVGRVKMVEPAFKKDNLTRWGTNVSVEATGATFRLLVREVSDARVSALIPPAGVQALFKCQLSRNGNFLGLDFDACRELTEAEFVNYSRTGVVPAFEVAVKPSKVG